MTGRLRTGLLFIFGVEHRSDETGLLFALGIPLSRVRYIFIIEGAVIAFFGSIPGAAAGIFYNRIILYGLSTIWQGALGTSDLVIHIKAPSILTGVFSGTGGFAFYGETTLPVLYDLNSDTGRKNFRLSGIEEEGVRFVQLRVHEGDDASCLNLNRIEKPRLLGVNPEELAARGSFSFVKTIDRSDGKSPWLLLNKHFDNDTIPAIADQTVMSWGIKKSVGDTIAYTDERGKEFKLILVGGLRNSIFQGNILISEKSFLERFPSTSGSRVLLIDLPVDLPEKNVEQIAEKLQKASRGDLLPTLRKE